MKDDWGGGVLKKIEEDNLVCSSESSFTNYCAFLPLVYGGIHYLLLKDEDLITSMDSITYND